MAATAAQPTFGSGDSKKSLPISIPSPSSAATSTMARPQSALARGVKITEIATHINPTPIVPEESDYLLEDYLSPRKLKLLAGVEDLAEVKYLEMKVDTRDTSLGNFGMHLPNLSQLKLSNSIITQTRDLGTCLDGVRVLWMAQCGLEDIDGLSSMFSLRELYLAYNDIADISPCSMLEHLHTLDLEGNAISDISQVEFLSLCRKLENLTLEGNPICTTPSIDKTSSGYNYRRTVHKAVPQLIILDNEPLKPLDLVEEDVEEEGEREDRTGSGTTSACAFQDDWNLINELYRDGTLMDRDEVLEEELLPAARPGTSSLRPSTGYRPGSALKPYTATLGTPQQRLASRQGGSRQGSRHGARPDTMGSSRGSSRGSSSRPGTSGFWSDDQQQDDSSVLTQGDVMCGNLSKALLRSRKGNKPKTSQNKEALKMLAQLSKTEHIFDSVEAEEVLGKDLKDELEQWRSNWREQKKKIEATKAPQVLTIEHGGELDHDDAISLSDDDDESIVTDSENQSDIGEFDLSLPKEILNQQETSPLPDSGISSDQAYEAYAGAKPKKQFSANPPNPARRRLRMRTSEEAFASPNTSILPPSTSHYNPSPPSSGVLPRPPSNPAVPPINGTNSPGRGGPSGFMRSPNSPLSGEQRPLSGSDSGNGSLPPSRSSRIVLGPVIGKSRSKVMEPVLGSVSGGRSSITPPEKRHANPLRASPHSPHSPSSSSSSSSVPMRSIRTKGQLANVALLPSKPPSFTRSDNNPSGSRS